MSQINMRIWGFFLPASNLLSFFPFTPLYVIVFWFAKGAANINTSFELFKYSGLSFNMQYLLQIG